ELQLEIMKVLWSRREATAAEVQLALEDRELAITTVSTLLSRLEKRGIVTHRNEGRLFIYQATLSEPDVRASMVGSLVDSMFGGDPAALVSQLLSARDVSPGDVDRMRKLIDDSRRRGGKPRG
ncbi:MAG: BlaI family transcriptional regulator, partial [Gemmatimonadetes bacterium]|nr:BlaI family transcriptional regulator [Gemmatimonadota bacterium]